MIELDTPRRIAALYAATKYLASEGYDIDFVIVDEAIHRFIEAYENGSTSPSDV